MTDKQLDAGDLDSAVLRELTALGSFTPRRGFSDRVMARVRLPQPAALVRLKRAGAWVLQPRRAVTLATAYAASVVVAIRLALPWIQGQSSALQLGVAWVGSQLSAFANGVALTVADIMVRTGGADALRSVTGSGRLWTGLAALSVGYAVCGYGFYALLKSPGRHNALVRN